MLRDDNLDEESLLSKDVGRSNEYEPVIKSKRKRIMFCLSLDTYHWALYMLINEVVTIFSFSFAASLGKNPIGNLSLVGAYMLFSCVAAPLWQFFSVQDVASGDQVGCDRGCIVGMACVHLSGLCTCRNLVLIRDDKQALDTGPSGGGGWNEPLPLDPDHVMSRSTTVSSITTTTSAHTAHATRYIPFSLYNLVFTLSHQGRQELNPQLPPDMASFGMARSLLLCFGTSLRASFNLALVYNAYYALEDTDSDNVVYLYISLGALASALADLDVYLVAVFYGTILYPYTLLVSFAFYLPMCEGVLNPPQGSFLFWVFTKYWSTVVGCVSEDVVDNTKCQE